MGRRTTEVMEPSHQVYHGHILSPLRLTLVPWLRSCLSGFCLWSSSFFPHNTLWKGVAVCNTHIRSEEFCSLPHDGKHLHKLFGILSLRRFVSPSPFIYLFNHFFIPVWTHGYLFYIFILGYNSMLYYLLGCSIFFFPVLANGSLFRLAPVSLWSAHPLIFLCFSLFSDTILDALGSSFQHQP